MAENMVGIVYLAAIIIITITIIIIINCLKHYLCNRTNKNILKIYGKDDMIWTTII